ncbi:hypothetical protein [Rhodovulum sp. 12E13]|uniref:hypothetical protein n=1 Tax=Rhodovulum sp. 12E13 TaxID=2203891 RepID=UPI0035186D9E
MRGLLPAGPDPAGAPFAIAASLIVTPGVPFLDEPTTALDPTARQRVWRRIGRLAGSGVTVLLTTPYLEGAGRYRQRAGGATQEQDETGGSCGAPCPKDGGGSVSDRAARGQKGHRPSRSFEHGCRSGRDGAITM